MKDAPAAVPTAQNIEGAPTYLLLSFLSTKWCLKLKVQVAFLLCGLLVWSAVAHGRGKIPGVGSRSVEGCWSNPPRPRVMAQEREKKHHSGTTMTQTTKHGLSPCHVKLLPVT